MASIYYALDVLACALVHLCVAASASSSRETRLFPLPISSFGLARFFDCVNSTAYPTASVKYMINRERLNIFADITELVTSASRDLEECNEQVGSDTSTLDYISFYHTTRRVEGTPISQAQHDHTMVYCNFELDPPVDISTTTTNAVPLTGSALARVLGDCTVTSVFAMHPLLGQGHSKSLSFSRCKVTQGSSLVPAYFMAPPALSALEPLCSFTSTTAAVSGTRPSPTGSTQKAGLIS
ncbi:uncharacterized protein PAN0_020d5977 [Moesziomyces antarcticus]|uniref:Uncharacterized protein n=2 Tax=Pseudozyma antarctica TaxID=84753 RepID=A0A081CM52_PSEA2|nr:uncharacterized protein PAN0_020d5977 [Moesziomyces antarcticus]GAK67748.1 hypothetical protein PAN0_020d5977 [Moesziomyces antarcticus]SPO49021.1 uncharacterized protein PSANT_06712 [Moesziomyces antarcticus]